MLRYDIKMHIVNRKYTLLVGGLDPKSPAGTAAAFSKANRQALVLANSSHFLEFTSNEIINSLNR